MRPSLSIRTAVLVPRTTADGTTVTNKDGTPSLRSKVKTIEVPLSAEEVGTVLAFAGKLVEDRIAALRA